MMKKELQIVNTLILIFLSCLPGLAQQNLSVKKSEFVFEKAPFLSCHASTISETSSSLVVAFFGGTNEGNQDVCIWMSTNNGSGWSAPKEVENGKQPDGSRYPCWNPVLYNYGSGPLVLFYKVGPSPSKWWGMMSKSYDNGITWSNPEKLPDGFMGPVKDKPVMLKNGVLLCPSSTENNGWNVQMEMTSDTGRTWKKILVVSGEKKLDAIQPSVVFQGGRTGILCRTKEGCIASSWSSDDGSSWSPLVPASLPNPNSGIDAVTLKNGNHLLVYNPVSTVQGHNGPRTPLTVALSSDGINWQNIITLESEPGEYSYPAVIQTKDGKIHITYTWKRKLIKHVVLGL